MTISRLEMKIICFDYSEETLYLHHSCYLLIFTARVANTMVVKKRPRVSSTCTSTRTIATCTFDGDVLPLVVVVWVTSHTNRLHFESLFFVRDLCRAPKAGHLTLGREIQEPRRAERRNADEKGVWKPCVPIHSSWGGRSA